MLQAPPTEYTGGLEHQAVVKRIGELKGKLYSASARHADVVYMSKHYWDVIKEVVIKNRGDEFSNNGGMDKIEDLVIMKVTGDARFLQVGFLFDTLLGSQPRPNIVPNHLRKR